MIPSMMGRDQGRGQHHEYESSTVQSRKGKKDDKEGGFLGKFGTLTRRKKSVPPEERGHSAEKEQLTKEQKEEKEAELLEKEGKETLESCLVLHQPDLKLLEDGQSVRVLVPESRDDAQVNEIVNQLLYWVNDELADERIVVRNVQEDFYDGQIVQKLLEKLADIRIEIPEVSQSEAGQKEKWNVLVDALNRNIHAQGPVSKRWNAELIHQKDVVAILQLLIDLALHFRAPVRFPNNVNVQMIVYTRNGRQITKSFQTEQLTGKQSDLPPPKGERDAFDTLFDYGPDKLQHVKGSLVAFCNKHLNKINLEVTDLETQFQDGVFLILLMGLLEGYFVPLYKFSLQVTSHEEKLKNVNFAFFLMEDSGIQKPKTRPHDIVNGDLKSTLRVLHALFTKYKHA
ncbi:unnamed protein product [Bursaphelenchus okinawaensis]|uniref:Calponin-homology (CH) domain-containing protein n=1 Tax=Bursaphelenchus okinawaensis TaxID=465554 RepID=A0A811KR32_9BILA|nr:unnamed protein product [Bursaphelenchus okinawaensis]CAG9112212.1 unnamed protein product [Bursaphelenchus okinawaensis]